MVLSQYTYIFAIGTLFALLDAYNNGANDVANSWATSVSSRSLTYRQAMIGATIFEFLGAVTVGARTADTVKNGIVPVSAFQGNPAVQMLAFTCALAVSASWVMWCTRHSVHVSSTYSIISAVAGVGVATAGAGKVHWGWNKSKGLGAIFAGLIIAPGISACFGAAIYLLVKFVVLARKNPVYWSIYTGPFFFFLASVSCTMSIIYKGAPQLGLNKKSPSTLAAAIVGTGAVVALLSALFWVPYVHAKVIKKDYTVRWYHFFMGPLLWSRHPPADANQASVPDYRVVQGVDSHDIINYRPGQPKPESTVEHEKKASDIEDPESKIDAGETTPDTTPRFESKLHETVELDANGQPEKKGPLGWALRQLRENPMKKDTAIYEWVQLKTFFGKRLIPSIVVGLLYGVSYDIHAAQTGIRGTVDGERMAKVYSSAKQYPNEVEHAYSFIQVLTACTASFAHGSNDIGNAIGPWAVIYSVWHTGDPAAAKAHVPIWQLAVGGIMLGVGLATYGYNIMKVMGNKLTYHSPSRGSSMEMGAALTVILAAQYGIPVSTTMCITGATIGVGLCNGRISAVNWQRAGLLLLGWIITIPLVGTLAGCLMGLILNAPHFA